MPQYMFGAGAEWGGGAVPQVLQAQRLTIKQPIYHVWDDKNDAVCVRSWGGGGGCRGTQVHAESKLWK